MALYDVRQKIFFSACWFFHKAREFKRPYDENYQESGRAMRRMFAREGFVAI